MARLPSPECPECGMSMRRVYVHMGATKRQRTLGIGWVCLNCKTVKWDYPTP